MTAEILYNNELKIIELKGCVGFNNVMALQTAGEQLMMAHDQGVIDLGQLSAGNTACVAMLMAWKRHAIHLGQSLNYQNVPAFMQRLSKVHGVDQVLF